MGDLKTAHPHSSPTARLADVREKEPRGVWGLVRSVCAPHYPDRLLDWARRHPITTFLLQKPQCLPLRDSLVAELARLEAAKAAGAVVEARATEVTEGKASMGAPTEPADLEGSKMKKARALPYLSPSTERSTKTTVATAEPATTLASQMLLYFKTADLFKFALSLISKEPKWAAASERTSPTASSSSDEAGDRDLLSLALATANAAVTAAATAHEAADVRREDERLKSFAAWPIPFLRPRDLAATGFYYLGRGDEVRCAFCKVEIMRWEEGDDPAVEHARWAPQCPMVRKRPAGNVAVSSAPASGRDECGTRAPPSSSDRASGAVGTPGPACSRYASEAARLRSFADWPRSLRQKPEELAEAGFYYTGQGDKTRCFYCDGGVKDWEEEDVPWEEHARLFDRCPYVQLVKGREYARKLRSEWKAPEEERSAAATPAPVVEAAPSDESKLCRICFGEERNVCFVPCGHVVACAKCALSADSCPMCRRSFASAVRLYYS